MYRGKRSRVHSALTGVIAVLLLPSMLALVGLQPPLGLAAAVQNQRDPTACTAVGINWTNCQDAFSSNDIYASASSPPFARPDRTIAAGNWTAVGAPTHHEAVDEVTPNDDADRVEGTTQDDLLVVGLSTVPDPEANTGHTIRVTASATGTGTRERLEVHLFQGAMLIATLSAFNVDRVTYATESYTLSAAEADLITDYADLRIHLHITRLEATEGVRVTQTEFEVPGKPARDTAWRDFGFALGESDTLNTVEVGVEWFRTNAAPILNVTVSWDGGTTWAAKQTATNKSSDDDTLELLDFTAATAWDADGLSDANFRVRVGTNASGARLDYVAVRVAYVDVSLDLTLSATATAADPGDPITVNATVRNLGSGPAQDVLIEGFVDPNATFVSSVPSGTYDAAVRAIRWTVPSLPSGASTSVEWTVRVDVGTPDQATVTSRARVEGRDSGGAPLPPEEASSTATVRAPVFTPVLSLDRTEAERGDEVEATVRYDNTGSGIALLAWMNWTLGGHYEVVALSPETPYSVSAQGFSIVLRNTGPGPHSLIVRLRVLRGMADDLAMEFEVAWSATDGNGNPLAAAVLPQVVYLHAPSITLSLEPGPASVRARSAFSLNLTVRNLGQATATGWLNLTLPAGVAYVGDNGTFPLTLADERLAWRLASLPAGSFFVLRVEFQATGDPGLETFRFALNFTDGKGSPPRLVLSNGVSVQFLLAESSFDWPWWLFVIGAAAAVAAALFFVLRRRLTGRRIEEVFVVHRNGMLLAHRSRTPDPERDQDILISVFEALRGSVPDALSKQEEGPIRLQHGHWNILLEQGQHHYAAVVFQGEDKGFLAARLSHFSRSIETTGGDTRRGPSTMP